MKKSEIGGILAYLMVIALALIFCFTVLRGYSSESGIDNGFLYWLYIVGAIVLGTILNAILFEFAHRVGAKAGRYIILSTNVLGLMFTRVEGKKKVKFTSFDGLTGETKIRPNPDAKKEPNPRPYLLFGTVFYAVEIILVVVIFVVLTSLNNVILSDIAYFILTMGVVGGVILLYNILPFRLDSITDGYRLTMISNPKNKEAFNELLRVEYEISQGNSDVEIKTFETITNFTADLNLNKVYALLDKREFIEAEKLLDIILSGKEEISKSLFLRARAQKIYINLMTKPLEEAKKYYEEEVKLHEMRDISHDVSMPSIRTYILVSGLIDKSHSETIITLNNVDKAFKRTPEKRKPIEESLYNETLNRLIEAHPNWEDLKDYKLGVQENEEEKE